MLGTPLCPSSVLVRRVVASSRFVVVFVFVAVAACGGPGTTAEDRVEPTGSLELPLGTTCTVTRYWPEGSGRDEDPTKCRGFSEACFAAGGSVSPGIVTNQRQGAWLGVCEAAPDLLVTTYTCDPRPGLLWLDVRTGPPPGPCAGRPVAAVSDDGWCSNWFSPNCCDVARRTSYCIVPNAALTGFLPASPPPECPGGNCACTPKTCEEQKGPHTFEPRDTLVGGDYEEECGVHRPHDPFSGADHDTDAIIPEGPVGCGGVALTETTAAEGVSLRDGTLGVELGCMQMSPTRVGIPIGVGISYRTSRWWKGKAGEGAARKTDDAFHRPGSANAAPFTWTSYSRRLVERGNRLVLQLEGGASVHYVKEAETAGLEDFYFPTLPQAPSEPLDLRAAGMIRPGSIGGRGTRILVYPNSFREAYDEDGALVAQTDVWGNRVFITYDAVDKSDGKSACPEPDPAKTYLRKTIESAPAGGFERYSIAMLHEWRTFPVPGVPGEQEGRYQLVRLEDSTGRVATVAYDAAGRLTKVVWDAGLATEQAIGLDYEAQTGLADRITYPHPNGDAANEVAVEHASPWFASAPKRGGLSRVTAQTRTIDGARQTTRFDWGAFGDYDLAVTLPDATKVLYGHEVDQTALDSGGAPGALPEGRHRNRVTRTSLPNSTAPAEVTTWDPIRRLPTSTCDALGRCTVSEYGRGSDLLRLVKRTYDGGTGARRRTVTDEFTYTNLLSSRVLESQTIAGGGEEPIAFRYRFAAPGYPTADRDSETTWCSPDRPSCAPGKPRTRRGVGEEERTFEYPDDRRVIVRHINGQREETLYDARGCIREFRDRAGVLTTREVDPDCLARRETVGDLVIERRFDGMRNVVREASAENTEEGIVETRTFRVVAADGTVGAVLERRTAASTGAIVSSTTTTHDGRGNVLGTVEEVADQRMSRVITDASNGERRVVTTTRIAGQDQTSTEVFGRDRKLLASTDECGVTTTYEYDERSGLPRTVRSPDRVMVYDYAPSGRLMRSAEQAADGTPYETIDYVWNTTPSLAYFVAEEVSSVSGATRTRHARTGEVTQIDRPHSITFFDFEVQTETAFGGRLKQIRSLDREAGETQTTTFAYHPTDGPPGERDCVKELVIDDVVAETYTCDANGRRATVTRAGETSATQIVYSALGDEIGRTNPDLVQARRYQGDRVVAEVLGEGRSTRATQYEHDRDARTPLVITRNDGSTETTHATNGFITGRSYTAPTNADARRTPAPGPVSFAWNGCGLERMIDAAGCSEFEYDAAGNPKSELRMDVPGCTAPVEGHPLASRVVTSHERDGKLMPRLVATGIGTTMLESLTFSGGRASGVVVAGTEITPGYDGEGRVTSARWSNGIVQNWSYKSGTLAGAEIRRGSEMLFSSSFAEGRDGLVRVVEDRVGGVVARTQLSYDARRVSGIELPAVSGLPAERKDVRWNRAGLLTQFGRDILERDKSGRVTSGPLEDSRGLPLGRPAQSGDFNFDFSKDAVVQIDGRIEIWLLEGHKRIAPPIDLGPVAANAAGTKDADLVAVGDFDGDGMPDVLLREPTANPQRIEPLGPFRIVFLNPPSGRTGAITVREVVRPAMATGSTASTGSSWGQQTPLLVLTSLDVDSDGKDDIVTGYPWEQIAGRVDFTLFIAGWTFDGGVVRRVPDGALDRLVPQGAFAGVGDVSRDALDDFVFRLTNGMHTLTRASRGPTGIALGPAILFPSPPPGQRLIGLVDVDADGDLDLVTGPLEPTAQGPLTATILRGAALEVPSRTVAFCDIVAGDPTRCEGEVRVSGRTPVIIR